MPSRLEELLRKQSAWQRARSNLSWPEKIRMAEIMRHAARELRRRSPREAASQLEGRRDANQQCGKTT